jgi:hypothetical protein
MSTWLPSGLIAVFVLGSGAGTGPEWGVYSSLRRFRTLADCSNDGFSEPGDQDR